jgi:hypothetical protein
MDRVFGSDRTTPHIVLRHGKFLPSYMHDFIGRLSPRWDRNAIEAAMRSKRVRPAHQP